MPRVFFSVLRTENYPEVNFQVELKKNDYRPFYDVIVGVQTVLARFKDKWGLYLPDHGGYKFADDFNQIDLNEFQDNFGRNEEEPICIVNQFRLKFEVDSNRIQSIPFNFSSCFKFDNAINFLKKHVPTINADDIIYLDEKPMDPKLTIKDLLLYCYTTIKQNQKFIWAMKRNLPIFELDSLYEIKKGSNTDIEHYMKVASSVRKAKGYPLTDLADFLKAAADDKSFVFISGPSWSGKTQFVYVLDQYSQHPMRLESTLSHRVVRKFFCVLHLVLESKSAQSINQAVQPISQNILKAIGSDFSNIHMSLAAYIRSLNEKADTFELEFKSLLSFCNDYGDCRLDAEWFWQARLNQTPETIQNEFSLKLKNSVKISMRFIELLSGLIPFKTLALLKELIKKREQNTTLDSPMQSKEISPITLKEFTDFISSQSKLPVIVCLDEFNLSKADSEGLFIFLRNFIRVIPGLVPVLLGTNTKVTNIIDNKLSNSEVSRDGNSIWCRIILKLPPVSLNTLDIPKPLTDIDEKIINWLSIFRQRPGILFVFTMTFRKVSLSHAKQSMPLTSHLKETFQRTLKALVEMKEPLKNSNTMDGYYQMIFSKYHEKINDQHNCSLAMIHQHLAHLLPDREDHFASLPLVRNIYKIPGGSDLKYYKSKPGESLSDIATKTYCDEMNPYSQTFSPTTVYLDLAGDELTNMIMFSDWSEAPIDKATEPCLNNIFLHFYNDLEMARRTEDSNLIISAKQRVLKKIKANPSISVFSLSFRAIVEILHNTSSDDDKDGKSVRSGNKLESLINGSFVKASAAAGPSGAPLEIFLINFFSELSLNKLNGAKWTQQGLDLLGPLKDQMVPYVIAVNYLVSHKFKSIEGIFSGSLPIVSNYQQMDGCCIPDWVAICKDEERKNISAKSKKKKNSAVGNLTTRTDPVLENAEYFLKNARCQMFITLEMKNYQENINASVIESVLRKAATNGRKNVERWPKSRSHPIRHLHLFCVSSLALIKDWTLIHSKSSHVLQVFQLIYNANSNEFGLQKPISDPSIKTNSKAKGKVNHSDLDVIAKLPPAPEHFPPTTVIIVSLKDLFGYGFESAYNILSNPPTEMVTQTTLKSSKNISKLSSKRVKLHHQGP